MGLAARRWTLVVLVGVGSLIACLWWLSVHGPSPWQVVAVFAIMAVLAEWGRIRLGDGAVTSLTSVVLLTCGALFGPVSAAVAAVASALLAPGTRRTIVRAFNAGMTCALAIGAGLIYAVTGGWSAQDEWVRADAVRHVALPLAAAGVTMWLINVALLTVVSGARADVLTVVRGLLERGVRPYALSTAASFLFITLWVGARLDETSIVLMAAPLLLAQWSMREQDAVAEGVRRSVASLVGAVGTFDPPPTGSAEHQAGEVRGNDIQEQVWRIGRRLNLSAGDLDSLRQAVVLVHLGEVDAQRSPVSLDRRIQRSLDRLEPVGHFAGAVRMLRDASVCIAGHGRGVSLAGQVLAASLVVDPAAHERLMARLDPRVVRAFSDVTDTGSHAATRAGDARALLPEQR